MESINTEQKTIMFLGETYHGEVHKTDAWSTGLYQRHSIDIDIHFNKKIGWWAELEWECEDYHCHFRCRVGDLKTENEALLNLECCFIKFLNELGINYVPQQIKPEGKDTQSEKETQ
jgi:hypothetical protein